MERDFFKQYVQEHKEAFENEALPPNMLGNILDKLKEREAYKAPLAIEEPMAQRELSVTSTQKFRLSYTWLAAACTLLIIGGAFLLLSRETAEVKQNGNRLAITPKAITEQPEVTKAPEKMPKIGQPSPTQMAAKKSKANAYQQIYDGLADTVSVAARLDAIIKAGSLTALNESLKTKLCKTFNEDSNDHVRLAALEVLSKFSNDKYVHQQLTAGLSKQKDPVVQLELIKIMGNNSNPETTDKLIAMANNPLTIDAVKEQVYYALLTNQ